jgi:hypothetical protein
MGFGNEAEAVVKDVRVVADVFRAQGAKEGALVIKDGLTKLGATEGGVKDALLGTFFNPIKNDIQSGRPDLAIGRAAFHIVTTVFPGDKVLRAASSIIAEGTEKI